MLEKETALKYLFTNLKTEDLKLTYELYKGNEKQLQLVAGAFTQHVYQRGMTLVEKCEAAQVPESTHVAQSIIMETKVVELLIEILDESRMLSRDCFEKATMFERAKSNAFEDFMGKQIKGLSFAEILGTYTDRILRKSGFK